MRATRLAILALATFAVVGAAPTQDAKGKAAPRPSGPPSPVTKASLPALLRSAGYTPTKVTESWYTIPVDVLGAAQQPFDVSLSESGEKIWVHVHLGSVEDASKAPPAVLARLLQLNDEGIAHFLFRKGQSGGAMKDKLYMALSLDNRGVTPALFKTAVDKLVREVTATRDAWQVQRWTAKPAR